MGADRIVGQRHHCVAGGERREARLGPVCARTIRQAELCAVNPQHAIGIGPAPADRIEIERNGFKLRGPAGKVAAGFARKAAGQARRRQPHLAARLAHAHGNVVEREGRRIAQAHAAGRKARRGLAEPACEHQRAGVGGKRQGFVIGEQRRAALGAKRHLLPRQLQPRQRERAEPDRRAPRAERQPARRRPAPFKRQVEPFHPAAGQIATGGHQPVEPQAPPTLLPQAEARDRQPVRARAVFGHRHAQRPAAVRPLLHPAVDRGQARPARQHIAAQRDERAVGDPGIELRERHHPLAAAGGEARLGHDQRQLARLVTQDCLGAKARTVERARQPAARLADERGEQRALKPRFDSCQLFAQRRIGGKPGAS